jgi:hypothetical protein
MKRPEGGVTGGKPGAGPGAGSLEFVKVVLRLKVLNFQGYF